MPAAAKKLTKQGVRDLSTLSGKNGNARDIQTAPHVCERELAVPCEVCAYGWAVKKASVCTCMYRCRVCGRAM